MMTTSWPARMRWASWTFVANPGSCLSGQWQLWPFWRGHWNECQSGSYLAFSPLHWSTHEVKKVFIRDICLPSNPPPLHWAACSYTIHHMSPPYVHVAFEHAAIPEPNMCWCWPFASFHLIFVVKSSFFSAFVSSTYPWKPHLGGCRHSWKLTRKCLFVFSFWITWGIHLVAIYGCKIFFWRTVYLQTNWHGWV